MGDDLLARWLSRALVASFMVNVLLAVWLWSAKREPENVREATREYVEARQTYDTAKAERLPAIIKYRTLRDSLVLTDTIEVVRVLAAADTVIYRDSVALAAADAALAKADTLISALRRSTKPRLIVPFAEILYQPYSREYVGRLGVGANISRRLSLVVAAEARKEGPQAYAGVRITF